MKPLLSLRWRLLIGSVLWTSGLLYFAHQLSFTLFRHLAEVHSSTGRGLRVIIFPGGGTKPEFTRHLTIIALACMAGGLWQIRAGLKPFLQLRKRLGAVRDGSEQRIDGRYPGEVQPLVNDLNAFLEHREGLVRRAMTTAGDLAHGLKTPLAVLAYEADRAEAAGHHELAATIGQQVERMRRQVEYHLAHARAVASGATPGARSSVRESADGLIRTMQRIHAARGLTFHCDVPADLTFQGEREDLDEMLGNLLDNACKWARSAVSVHAAQQDARVLIPVDDDGPGIAPDLRAAVLQRGVRADEAAPGSGLGLAIVGDLAAVYGGSIALDTSPGGGLRAKLELPAV